MNACLHALVLMGLSACGLNARSASASGGDLGAPYCRLAVYDKTAEFEQFLDHCLRHHQQAHSA